ncbi:MAG: TIGR03905 family TSCPD domain-containing protein [Ruminococcaceae bacterium]|nr:TIGR03905 family TSCPD domain-containing protein [Oscillospiraceae bacterium]MBQ3215665.1 TIGR03905 family TSCPD domain-containing protein [Oscillospiraceae bacterium]
MEYTYKTRGVCSQMIRFEVEDNKVRNVQFFGGCNGNLKGIASLVEGMDIDEVIARIEGTKCGMKSTSCPDQLAQALKQAKAENA